MSDIYGMVRVPVLDGCKRAHEAGARSQAGDDEQAPRDYGAKNVHPRRSKRGHGLAVGGHVFRQASDARVSQSVFTLSTPLLSLPSL